MPSVPPFRITPEDLPDLDKSTRNGLQPLLDALNSTLGQTVPAVNGAPSEEFREVTLTTTASVAESFPLRFTTTVQQPRVVLLGNCRPKDVNHVMTTPFVAQGFGLTDAGLVSIPWITGLLASNTYYLTFWIR